MLASPEPVEAFTFTFNLSQVGTLKIRGTFRAKNRQQPHPFLVETYNEMNAFSTTMVLRLHRFARSTSAALLHYRFREIRHPQGRAAMDRSEFLRIEKLSWRFSNTTSVEGTREGPLRFFAGECLRRICPPQNLSGGRWGQGSGRAGNRRRQNTPTPPPPPGGVGVGGTPRRGGRGGTRGVKKTRFRGYYFGANPLCGITRGPPKMG